VFIQKKKDCKFARDKRKQIIFIHRLLKSKQLCLHGTEKIINCSGQFRAATCQKHDQHTKLNEISGFSLLPRHGT
jgi:hypothetical protein